MAAATLVSTFLPLEDHLLRLGSFRPPHAAFCLAPPVAVFAFFGFEEQMLNGDRGSPLGAAR